MDSKKLNCSSTKISSSMGIPHSAVVNKLKKYSRYKDAPLQLIRFSNWKNPETGSNEIVYQFNESAYDRCVKKELKATLKYKEVQREQGKKNIQLAHKANKK